MRAAAYINTRIAVVVVHYFLCALVFFQENSCYAPLLTFSLGLKLFGDRWRAVTVWSEEV